MKYVVRGILGGALLCGVIGSAHAQARKNVAVWLTDPARSTLFVRQAPLEFTGKGDGTVIAVEEKKTFQSIDGFGWALTDGSAQHIRRMSPAARAALLRELFGMSGNAIGGSYLRISIGASDLSDHVYSYDDLPAGKGGNDLAAGKTDLALAHFDLGPTRKEVVPVLKEILRINPSIKIMGSPWSPPVWMKTNHNARGGSLLPEFYPVYARYLVKFVQAMKREGIRIDAITVQNEPLHPGNTPSLLMPAAEEGEFVKHHLGPAFRRAGLTTKIIIYDHNADRPDYPLSILNDPEARPFVDGSAFHLYGGKIEALSQVHDAYPNKNLYFTEQWVGAPGHMDQDIREHVRNLIIGATRNWCRTVIEWNLSSNPTLTPHTENGGCDRCLGAVTIDGDKVTRNPAYYIIAHAAKFVRPGSVRIASTMEEGLPNVAFRTPEGKIVLIVLNDSPAEKEFWIGAGGRKARAKLGAGATATYIW